MKTKTKQHSRDSYNILTVIVSQTGSRDHGVCAVLAGACELLLRSPSSSHDNTAHTPKHEIIKSGSDGPDQEIATLMKNILKGKSLSCDDIKTISDAREELSRIRKLTSNYQKGKLGLGGEKKGGRNALHEEESINDYVKEVFPKDDNVRGLIYKSIEDKELFDGSSQDELSEIVDIFQPCSFGAGDVVIQQGQMGDEFYVVEKGELSVTVRVDVEHGETSVDGSFNEVKIGNYSDGSAFHLSTALLALPRSSQQTHANFGKSNAHGTGASLVSTGNDRLVLICCALACTLIVSHPTTRQKLRNEKIEFLNSVEINGKAFDDVFTKDQLSTIAELLKQESFIKGATIVREAELGDTLYIIQSGRVNIYKDGINNGNPVNSLEREQVSAIVSSKSQEYFG
ncbi:hypothetical protein THAOC_22228 [Thalassiosira oceanica]|uniref:Cyclic nucleotide-binding domain-containing protein n=1 Tax=Thalassiosira oceanica TaxID=159749 RepID=K0RV90_THAOC|nr:hypothetical protein THAOC_22228 [Thalassiosira oceanica]|eukprot:EJK57698.1 hypothetical protein THAOC_22228 [Thalassiosira oceanica]